MIESPKYESITVVGIRLNEQGIESHDLVTPAEQSDVDAVRDAFLATPGIDKVRVIATSSIDYTD